jgi:hypothetical protein
MPQFVLSSRRFVVFAGILLTLLCCTSPARGQGIGTHFETGELMPNLRFRPGIDGSFGGDYSLASINIEFLYSIPLKHGWALYQGGGPAIILQRISAGNVHDTSVHGGTFITFGFANENGFFTEFKLGGNFSPNLKFGAGFIVRKKKP